MKKQMDQGAKKKKKKMRTDREGKCIFPQAPSFPQNHCGSHLLHLPPLESRCNPGVRSSGVISISEFCSYLCCHCKMAKPEPQQNLLFHTAQAVNCPLFTLRLCFIQPWRGSNICEFIHREPSQTLSTLFTTAYLFFFFLLSAIDWVCVADAGIMRSNGLHNGSMGARLVLLVWLTSSPSLCFLSLNWNDLWLRGIRNHPLTFLKMSLIPPLILFWLPAPGLQSQCCLPRSGFFI